MFINKKLLIITLLAVGVGIVVTSGFFGGLWQATTFEVVGRREDRTSLEENKSEVAERFLVSSFKISPLSGLKCEDAGRRPFGVILAGDRAARLLSGLSEADLILDLPVLTGGITRYMAIYVCGNPSEIGSLRSARHDFIPLAMGLDAILAHWGGSHYALDLLNEGVMDNIDALPNPFGTFWRKPEIPPPHNGFTSMENLVSAARKLGYRLESRFESYPHLADKAPESVKSASLTIGYPYPYNVKYEYDSETNSYYRWRGGIEQIDKNNKEQLTAKVVVVMRAVSRQLEKEYNDLGIEGEGALEVYQNGEVISGTWKKDKADSSSKLYFLDKEGKEIAFVPGQIWVQIVEPYQKVSWGTEG